MKASLGAGLRLEVKYVGVLFEEGEDDFGRVVSVAQLEILVVGQNEEIHEWKFKAV